jgi:ABC-type transporter Mla subunit MlaD
MKRNFSDYVVALSVIICSAILLAALTIALTGFRFKKPSRTLQVDFEDVTGVKIHSEVRYAGAPAGRVIAMHHLSPGERAAGANKRNAVRVTVSLLDEIPPLPADVVATLSSDTMLSPSFVALSAGTPGGQTLANNAIIDGHPAYGLQQIMSAAGPLVDNANKLIDSLNATAGNLNTTVTSVRTNLDDFMPKISPVLDTAKTDLVELQRIIKGLDDVERNANDVLKNANGVFDNAGKFVGSTDKQLQEQMKELRVILLNLKVVSTHAKALVDTLAEKPNRLIFSGKTQTLTPESEILKSKEPLPASKKP